MSARERSIQQQYPLGAMTGRPVALIAAAAAPGYTIVMAWHNRADISSRALLVASLVMACAAFLIVVAASSPLRAPFTGQSAVFALLWASAGLVLGAASMWQTNTHIRDDWGSTAVGAIIVAIAPYRPPRELAIYGCLAAILAGFVTVLQMGAFVTAAPAIVFVVISITPIVVLTIGATQFTRVIVSGIERWRKRARVAVIASADEDSDWIARSVQQDTVTILNRDIVPFFATVLQDGTITEDDIDRARELADSIRSVMVAEVDRGWLATVIEDAAAAKHRDLSSAEVVVDEGRLAQRMTVDQRAAVRAFVRALFGHPDFTTTEFSVTVEAADTRANCVLRARLESTDTRMRSELAPYFAVLRVLFSDLTVEFAPPTLTLKFSYEQ